MSVLEERVIYYPSSRNLEDTELSTIAECVRSLKAIMNIDVRLSPRATSTSSLTIVHARRTCSI